jgi:hypothetical protein
MKYMLSTYLDETPWLSLSEAEQQQMMADCAPHVEQLIRRCSRATAVTTSA